jgi:hypothetical protein
MNSAVAANNYRLAHLAYTRFIPAPGPSSGGSGGGTVKPTIAALRAIITSDGPIINQVSVQGDVAAGDGGGGIYTWYVGDTTADDGNSVIRPSDYTTGGLWKKLV